jgi:hypothetical protein
VVVASGVGDGVAEQQADGGADHADQHALRDEDVAHLRFARAHRHEDGDVFGFFHDHHDEGNQDVQRGDEDDEADGDEGDQAFEAQGVEEGLFCSIQLVVMKPLPAASSSWCETYVGFVDVVDLEFDDGDQIAEAEELCASERRVKAQEES